MTLKEIIRFCNTASFKEFDDISNAIEGLLKYKMDDLISIFPKEQQDDYYNNLSDIFAANLDGRNHISELDYGCKDMVTVGHYISILNDTLQSIEYDRNDYHKEYETYRMIWFMWLANVLLSASATVPQVKRFMMIDVKSYIAYIRREAWNRKNLGDIVIREFYSYMTSGQITINEDVTIGDFLDVVIRCSRHGWSYHTNIHDYAKQIVSLRRLAKWLICESLSMAKWDYMEPQGVRQGYLRLPTGAEEIDDAYFMEEEYEEYLEDIEYYYDDFRDEE